MDMDRHEEVSPSLLADAKYLSDSALDGRYPGGPGHALAADYLQRRLVDLAFEPMFPEGFRQDIPDRNARIGQNIAGVWPGQSDGTLLLGAHYDHFQGIPGADDNACSRTGHPAGDGPAAQAVGGAVNIGMLLLRS